MPPNKGKEIDIDAEIVREQGEIVGYLYAEVPVTPVYYLDGALMFCEQGASKMFVYTYIGNPTDLYWYTKEGYRQIRSFYPRED